MKELLPRSSARVGLTRFCFLLLCGSGQRPSWLFESVTSHFAFIRSSFTLSMWLNTVSCSVSHMTSLVRVSSCQGAGGGAHGSLPLLSFPTLGSVHCVSSSTVAPGWACSIAVPAGLACWVRVHCTAVKGLFQVFFRIFRTFSVLHSVGRSTLCKLLQCRQAHRGAYARTRVRV